MMKILTDRLYQRDINDIDDKADFITLPLVFIEMCWGMFYTAHLQHGVDLSHTWWFIPAIFSGMMIFGPLFYWVSYHIVTIILFLFKGRLTK